MSGFSRHRVAEDEYFEKDRNFQDQFSAGEAASSNGPKVFTFTGTGGIDYVQGSDHIDVIKGLGGNDRLLGWANDDTLIGGADDDYLDGVSGRDVLIGGNGNDTLGGGTGLDTLIGGSGNDMLFLHDGDRAEGGSGDDTFVIQDGHETADGGGGTDTVELDVQISRFNFRYGDGFVLLTDKSLGSAGAGGPRLTTKLDDSSSIERVSFKDATIDFENPNAPEFEYFYHRGEKIALDALLQEEVDKITGKADPFSRVTLYADDVEIGHAMAEVDGDWAISVRHNGLLVPGVKLSATADYGPGRTVATSETLSPNFADFVTPSLLKSDEGLAIKGDDQGELGTRVSGLGDINGDGYDDFAVSAGRSTAYIVYGRDGDLTYGGKGSLRAAALSASDGFIVKATWDFQTTKAGDFNGDGYNDLLLSAPGRAGDDHGGAEIVFGGPEGLGRLNGRGQRIVDLDKLSANQALHVNGATVYSIDTDAISEVGDVNGDGVDDIVIGARGAMHEEDGKWISAGEAYVLFGRAGERGELEDGQRVIEVSALPPMMASSFAVKSMRLPAPPFPPPATSMETASRISSLATRMVTVIAARLTSTSYSVATTSSEIWSTVAPCST
jgi:hypothetical protein